MGVFAEFVPPASTAPLAFAGQWGLEKARQDRAFLQAHTLLCTVAL